MLSRDMAGMTSSVGQIAYLIVSNHYQAMPYRNSNIPCGRCGESRIVSQLRRSDAGGFQSFTAEFGIGYVCTLGSKLQCSIISNKNNMLGMFLTDLIAVPAMQNRKSGCSEKAHTC